MNGCATEYWMRKKDLVASISNHSSVCWMVVVMANSFERWKITSTMHRSEGV